MSVHQSNCFALAENLGMTVTQLTREMTLAEYFGWLQFFSEKVQATKKQPKPGKKPRGKDGFVMKGFDI